MTTMYQFGAAEVFFILCILAGLVGIYSNRPSKKYWDERVLDKLYAPKGQSTPEDRPMPD